jgi:hypothetical protein
MLIAALAHQGEELVMILPAAMLLGAFAILKWAAGGEQAAAPESGPPQPPVEPPDEAQPAGNPAHHHG